MQRSFKIFISVLVILCTYQHFTFAQGNSEESQFRLRSRTGATLEIEPVKDLKVSLEEQVRLKNFGELFDRNLIETQVNYDFLKDFKAGLGYRYISVNDDEGKRQGIRQRHRVHYRLGYSKKRGRSKFGLRVQYQHRRERDLDGSLSDWENGTWRFRAEHTQDIRNWKLDPELGLEIFNAVDRPRSDDKYRVIIGTTWRLPGPQELKFKYLFEGPYVPVDDLPQHILVVNYVYSLSFKK